MKILIISDAWKPQINGVVRTYEFIGKELENKGHTVKVIGPSDFPKRIPCPGYKEIELVIAPYKRLNAMISAFAPDHIHIATEGPLGKAAHKYCRLNNRHFTTSYHTHFPDYIAKRVAKFLPFLYNPVKNSAIKSLRKFHNQSNAMMIATQSLEDELKSWGFTAPMHRLTRGADLEIFHTGENTKFKDLPRPIAVFVGRVAIEKNIEAFLEMDWDGSKVVIGDGPDMAELQQKYPQGHFIGKKLGKDLGEHIRSADVFAFPSRTDTFGMVLVEAMACGLPIAAYNVTGPKDIITENFLGTLDETDLSKAAYDALSKTGYEQQRHAYVQKNYTWERAADQFIEIALNAEQ